jgi:hypothetical protein
MPDARTLKIDIAKTTSLNFRRDGDVVDNGFVAGGSFILLGYQNHFRR